METIIYFLFLFLIGIGISTVVAYVLSKPRTERSNFIKTIPNRLMFYFWYSHLYMIWECRELYDNESLSWSSWEFLFRPSSYKEWEEWKISNNEKKCLVSKKEYKKRLKKLEEAEWMIKSTYDIQENTLWYRHEVYSLPTKWKWEKPEANKVHHGLNFVHRCENQYVWNLLTEEKRDSVIFVDGNEIEDY